MRTVVLVALATLLFSCSIDYSANQLVDELSKDIPDTILLDVEHVIVRDRVPQFRVIAERAETFSEQNRQYLHTVEFTEYADDGSISTHGTAAYAEYRTDTEDIEITGDLRFYSASEDAWLTADYLFWDSGARRLTSLPDQPVYVSKGDGTRVAGRGFTAEMSRSTIYFEGGVSGTMIENNE